MTTIECQPISTRWPDLGEKFALQRTARIRILHTILSPNAAGEGEIFHGYRTYITMLTMEPEPILTILPDLGEKLA